ncbi:MAG TPA: hypothetical protein VLC74_12590, partial [Rhizomicrobium sp.]|nr:hypothetical protein [Rhizomicrobium sp.]
MVLQAGEVTMSFVRMCALALVALGVWFLCALHDRPRSPLLHRAPAAAEFSTDRARATLARVLPVERAHPLGTAENAAVRARILKELAALNVPARTYTAFTCNSWRG